MCRLFERQEGIPKSGAKRFLFLLLLSALISAWAQQSEDGWKIRLQQQVSAKNLSAARQIAEKRIDETPADLEAHGWRARLLAWQGHWTEAESEYRFVLQRAPNDTDILVGLSDVLAWQQRSPEALKILDQARSLEPKQTDILIRRARVLGSLGLTQEARGQFREVLTLDPSNAQAKAGLQRTPESMVHELRFGTDFDTFSYTGAAQTYGMSLGSHWTSRWSTLLASDLYERFGATATKFSVSTAYRFTLKDWLNIGVATAHDEGVIPRRESFFGYGHAFRFKNTWIPGLESSYQQHWLWFRDAKVLVLTSTQLLYLRKDWTWTVSATGAGSTFAGANREWRPSGITKLSFPLHRRLTGNTFVAVGSENYALVDQIGSFSAHTYGGGCRIRFSSTQDVSSYLAHQNRSTGRSQTSFGVSYGIRF